ncbi:Protein of unknown function DUF829, TMEM53 [Cynara cardunculus var. scolymus]|uniref:Uncharacterized protein n=1 Tax=Cynara cardunculus var. scolymus TaxID=59895 RepID=A0A103XYS3_CYNCS|nr:Protein of unknown function DUF829, TMEM53 [Cynara cardunculus var. scolymus]
MWGFGGRFYWGRRNQDETRGNTKGIVVVFAWMSSQDKHLKNYIHLYSSLGWDSLAMGAPYLILCSENDELAPYQIICNFVQRLENLGGDVKLVKWSNSPHVGHYRHHPEEYRAAVIELLTKAGSIYSTRVEQQLKSINNETSEPVHHLQEPLVSGSRYHQNSKRLALDLNQRMIVPRSMAYDQVRETGPVQGEAEERFIRQSVMAEMNCDGIVGEILFDVGVLKNVEDWDLRSFGRHSDINFIKCIRRSKM